jgi:hypothetical protein
MGIQSGYTWKVDPVADPLGGPGRTKPVDVRAAEDYAVRGKLKKSPDPSTREGYSIGMEHVALTLGRNLGLPIPEAWLATVLGRPVCVVERVPSSRNWLQAEEGTPMMLTAIQNDDIFSLGTAFDIWMANTGVDVVGAVQVPRPPRRRPPVRTVAPRGDHGDAPGRAARGDLAGGRPRRRPAVG